MTRIRATCPVCGEVDLRVDDMQVRVITAEDGTIHEGSNYRFRCPSCDTMVTKPADDRVVELLESGGVPITRTPAALLHHPSMWARSQHPEEPRGGPALTSDDLLDFHLMLEDDSWFEELAALVG